MKKKNKLLIVGSFPSGKRMIYGGIARSSEILINSKSFSRFQIIKFDSSQISNPPPNIIIRSFLAFIRLIKFILTIITVRPDAVLVFCSDGASAIEKGVMIFISKIFKAKGYIFPRAGNLIVQVKKSKTMLWVIKTLFNNATIFLCQGDQWRKFAINSLKINPQMTEIISNWSASNDLISLGDRRKINKSLPLTKILYIGWLEKEKGINELMEAFSRLYLKNKNIQLYLVGDGSLRIDIEDFIKNKNLSNNIFLKGWMSSDNVKNYLVDSDIFILPSWKEGMPNALIEALATGLPSIATSVGVIPDYLEDDVSALLIEPKNSNNIQNSLEKLINDINLRNKLSKNGLSVAKKFFASESSLENFSKVIQESLN